MISLEGDNSKIEDVLPKTRLLFANIMCQRLSYLTSCVLVAHMFLESSALCLAIVIANMKLNKCSYLMISALSE